MVAGEDLSLSVLVAKMVGSEVWRAVVTFCEGVVLQRDGGMHPPSGIDITASTGVAAAVANSSDDEEGEPEKDEGDVPIPPFNPSSPSSQEEPEARVKGATTPHSTQGR